MFNLALPQLKYLRGKLGGTNFLRTQNTPEMCSTWKESVSVTTLLVSSLYQHDICLILIKSALGKCTVLITANVGFLAFHPFEDSKVIPVAFILASIFCSLVAVFGGQFFIFSLGAMSDKDGKSLVSINLFFWLLNC